MLHIVEVKNMSKRNKIRAALSGVLLLAIVATCAAVYQSGSNSTPNEKQLVKNEEDTVDEAMKTEEKPEDESQDANTSQVEGTREVEEAPEVPEESAAAEQPGDETQSADASQAENVQPEAETQDTSAAVDEQAAMATAPDVNFTESSLMEWPVSGQVAIDYDMDHTVYFPTLNEFKYNPAIVISSAVDTPVASVANGKVVSVEESVETGTTMTVDLGNGYQAVYGQLKDAAYQPDQYVEAGSTLGYVSEPTIYYTTEGANLYFALTKDGTPLDPLQYLP